MKKTLHLLFVSVLLLCLISVQALASETELTTASAAAEIKSGDLSLSSPTQLDLAIERNYAKQFTYDSVFAEQPSVTNPYAAGSLTQEYLESGLAHLNYIRYAAGLPSAALEDSWVTAAQHGAVVLAANNILTHYPSQPTDMPDDFFSLGYSATTTGNISYSYGYGTRNYLIFSLTGCMSDSDNYNIPVLGHRRWLLNPLKSMTVGFGEANSLAARNYVVTKVFNNGSSGTKVDYRYVAWPSAGNFPTDLLAMDDAWSVTLNPSYYSTPQASNILVTITRKADGKSWTLDSSNYTTSPSIANPYFNVNTQNCGVNNCIIFHPGYSNWAASNFSGVYTVSISGLTTKSGDATSLTYDVEFFDPASIQLPTYTVNISATTGGQASISAKTVTAGSNVTFQITPDSGYETAAVLINGVAQPLQDSYTLERITANTTVNLLFQDSETGYLTDGSLYYTLNDEQITVIGPVTYYSTNALAVPASFAGFPVTTIADEAFQYCYAPTITLPETITTIGKSAFYNSDAAGVFTIPASVQSIGTYAFSYMRNVTSFAISGENSSYMCEDGVLFEHSGNVPTTLLNYPLASTQDTYVIPSSVTLLYCTSFAQAENLTTIYAANHTLSAMTYTFYDCKVELYGRTSTSLYTQIFSNRLSGSITFRDIALENTFSLLSDSSAARVRIINLSNASTQGLLFMAGYDNARMLDCRKFTFFADANDVIFLETTAFAPPLIRFFHLDSNYVPLRPVVEQP